MRRLAFVALAACLSIRPALADFDLQITEIWPGQAGSNDITEDWFEITNFGDMPWSAATDGGLWFDDESAVVFEVNPDDGSEEAQAVPLIGISTIAPGESVIFVEGDETQASLFRDAWGPDLPSLPQVGYHAGSGLGGGGDAVTLFLDADNDGQLSADAEGMIAAPDVLLDNEAFPEVPQLLDGGSFDVILQKFSTVGVPAIPPAFPGIPPTPGAIATTALGGDSLDAPAIGTPGFVVPEPSTLCLIGFACMSMLNLRRS